MKKIFRVFFLLFLPFALTACVTGPDEIVRPASQAESPGLAYPARARRLMEEGVVRLRVEVLASGNAGKVRLRQSSGSATLDAAAVEGVKKFKFNPARTKSGRTVSSWVDLPVKYVLAD
ncbi:MAG: energy transducer TonB [Polaromonas sp.]